jgi:O-acetyl-ADP-ribose deacetylase (regulator of RNase III)
VWQGGGAGEAELLARAYRSAFARAHEVGAQSVAFPAISTGVYRFPADHAARIALGAMRAEEKAFERIVACVFDATMRGHYERVLSEV